MPSCLVTTTLGLCRITWDPQGIRGFRLPEDASGPRSPLLSEPTESATATDPVPSWVALLAERVPQHLAGRLQDFSDVPLDWSQVSEFQQQVYRKTQDIRPGQTSTYGAIARALGLGPAGARAVGVALATNPWPLLVPCHRVVAANGKMTGFSAPGGIRTKTRLLALEGAELLSE